MATSTSQLHEVLRKLMGAHISEAELARKTKIPQPTLHRILSGATTSPRAKSLAPLAKFFSITINQLLGHEPLPKNRTLGSYNPQLQGWSSIPLLQLGEVKHWIFSEDPSPYERWLSIDIEVSNKAFGIVVEGDSMAPLFEEGTILIIEPEQTPRNRDFVIAQLENQTTPLFKQILIDGDDRYLKSLNADYRTILMSEKDTLIGTLIQARIDFRS